MNALLYGYGATAWLKYVQEIDQHATSSMAMSMPMKRATSATTSVSMSVPMKRTTPTAHTAPSASASMKVEKRMKAETFMMPYAISSDLRKVTN